MKHYTITLTLFLFISVLFGQPTFTEHVISTSGRANFVYTADVDSDGDMDVLSSSGSDNFISWFENDGSESFTAVSYTHLTLPTNREV